MNEQQQVQNQENTQQDAPDVIAVLKRMQRQLDVMDEKLGTLIQMSKRETFPSKPFSKPFKGFSKTNRPNDRKFDRKKEGTAGEGKFYHGRPFGKKKAGGKSPFKKGKKGRLLINAPLGHS